MVRRGGPVPWTITHVDELKHQIENEAEQESPVHRHASYAASSLVDELTKMYYEGPITDVNNFPKQNIGKFQENARNKSLELGESSSSSSRRALSMKTVAAVGMLAGRAAHGERSKYIGNSF